MTADQNLAPRRRAGRPSRLSREIVVAAALELLDEVGTEQFSVTKLGKRLNATAMSIYTYFPSKDALLDAAAEHVFSMFTPPPAEERWQDFILAWLHAVTRHFDRFPVALQVLAWEEHVSASWLRAWAPLVRVLHGQEVDLKRLAAISGWFLTAAIGLISAHLRGPKRVTVPLEDTLMMFAIEDRKVLSVVYQYLENPDEQWRLDFGFRTIISGLEEFFSQNS